MQLLPEILASAAEIQVIRRNIHAYPELRFEEKLTADLVAEALSSWGIPLVRGMGKTGVVGRLDGELGPGKMIGLRADMDALPLQEHNTFAHASRHVGKMHACGHDGHTAMLLGAAQYLSNHRDFKGSVIFIFQPAEEGGGGAREMIKDGLFKQFPCDAVFGLHNWPGIPVGDFGVTAGPMMASSNAFQITVKGRGGHAALPHNSADPVIAGVNVVQALQSIITRNKRPVDAAVLSITQFHAGETSNVIPDSAFIGGTVRTFTLEVLDLIETRLREITHGVAGAFDCTAEIEFIRSYPPLINHQEEVDFAVSVITDLVGAGHVDAQIDPTMGAEDFAFMVLEKPGCYVFLGNGDGDHRALGHGMGPCHLHNPSYDFNDALIPIGVSYWVKLAQRFLA
ncbi:M20 family metallopeptidase [Polynucleobacter sp. IMCC30063]|uniref:M20 aminoacylase family protein n=1 Tax=unclassified Polynucleobacter TaxID=2640945 RepID=UPI001F3543CB|nr:MULTISPECIES: M20 aminoacylase family protein [unclassified Polynucleobacter]MCE7505031.1 M20 family metallopeptidase [Polynucleobacter sp. IMCC30063]MCE7526177.1 M20 family metallopeptidase [Polynucleobacter sp. IMCC 30228]MCE7528484.1 M20 family metallopeptidase [Polynucleobacter sp. IMCC 29146]